MKDTCEMKEYTDLHFCTIKHLKEYLCMKDYMQKDTHRFAPHRMWHLNYVTYFQINNETDALFIVFIWTIFNVPCSSVS